VDSADLVEADSVVVVDANVVSVRMRNRMKYRFGGFHMWYAIRNYKILAARLAMLVALFALIFSLASCNKSGNASAENKTVQKTFATPAEAGTAFFEAAQSGNQTAMLAIFGPDGKDALFSGDAVKDKNTMQDVVAAYTQMHRWREIKAGGKMLYMGADNYPFPIPLGQNPSGQWFFDTAAGKDEILARRIGRDELTAIAACDGIAGAQQRYFGQKQEFAQKFISDEGTQNGLYWPVSQGQPPSPFEDVRDFAKAMGYTNAGEKPQPFNGYFFRILTKQGDMAPGGAQDYIVNGRMARGFAALAYPAEYRNSGIMTFVVGKDGIVYQKDLGERTADIAGALTEYNPGDGWNPAI
jgi:hypothetical protein